MQDVIVGLLAVVIGAVFCFQGWVLLRVIIPIWGAFTGFMLGAGLVASWWDEGFLSTVAGWGVGALFAVVFGILAYLYYEVAVVLAMGAIGFALATSLLVAMGVTWSWLTILAGLGLGVLLALLAIVGNLPTVLLVILSAFAGSSVVVGGLMLLFGVIDMGTWSVETTQRLDDDWWWYAIYLVLALVGIGVQIRSVGRLTVSLRESWAEAGGKQFAG